MKKFTFLLLSLLTSWIVVQAQELNCYPSEQASTIELWLEMRAARVGSCAGVRSGIEHCEEALQALEYWADFSLSSSYHEEEAPWDLSVAPSQGSTAASCLQPCELGR